MSAQTVSEAIAHSRAAAFFANQAQQAPGAPSRSHANQQLTLAYTSQGNGNTRFYVYNRGENDGYVIVGGDEQAKEILAYVPQGHFVYDSLPTNMKWWLGQYEHEIDTAIIVTSHMPAVKAIHQTATQNTMQDIPDLITTKWNQGEPYNIAIPLIGGDTLHCPTGCVPTALAQIMNYWEYPIHGIGSNSYSIDYGDIGQTTFSADFANTTYDWAHMRDTYVEGQYTEQEAQAVATLMYHIGVALEVTYTTACGTGYSPLDRADNIQGTTGLMRDLPKYFGYDQGLEDLNREDFTLEQWKTLIYNELTLGRPVYYTGADLTSAHAFVCHGYSSTLDMFSFNWGWGGNDDGYYALSGTNAINGFSYGQSMLVGIRPAGYNTSSTHLCYGDKFLYNNVLYRVYDEQNRHVEVTHPEIANVWEGQQCDFDYCQGHVTIPSVVEHNGINYTVSRIGSYAFLVGNNGQTNINSVSLPSSIKSLGEGAFYYCQSVIDSIILPDSIEIIPQRCFEQCNRSPYISIPNSIQTIGASAYFGCRLLEQITIPEGCYRIYPFAFADCSRLSIVNLPSTIRLFGGGGIFWGTNLLKMTFPCDSFIPSTNDLELVPNMIPSSIENGTLYVPTSMVDTYRNTTDVFWSKWGTIASLDSVNPNLGKRFVIEGLEYQIYNDSCVNMTTVDQVDYTKQTIIVPSNVFYEGSLYNVKSIAAKAFYLNDFGLKGIDKLVISEGIKKIGEEAFHSCGFRVIELPNSLETIGWEAFRHCMELESLDIPKSVKGARGVYQCHSLKQLILHEGTISLSTDFLRECPKLEHAFFPKSIWFSSGLTMTECPSLKSIVSLTDSLTIAPNKVNWEMDLNEETYNAAMEAGGSLCSDEGYGTNHESVKLYVPDSLLQNPNSDYNNNYPWNQFPNKLPYVVMESFDIPDTISAVQLEQFVIPVQFFPANTSYQMLKWTSSDESVVSVSCEGVAYAHNVGQAVITASAIDGSTMSHSCVINVREMSIPTDTSSFYTHLPSEVFVSNPTVLFDTIAIPIKSNGGEVFVAFESIRRTRATGLFFSMAGQTFEIFTPSLSDKQEVVLRFNNVEPVDTLWIRWEDNRPRHQEYADAIIRNIRVWNENSIRYPVRFVNEDGQVLQDSLYQYGSVPEYFGSTPTKPATAQYTYTFAGWSPAITSVTDTATYIATFDSIVNRYVVIFQDEDSTLLQIDTLNYGAMPEYSGVTPTKAATPQYSYTFGGWNTAVVAVTGNAIYTVTYASTVNKYVVSFFGNDLLQRDTLDYGTMPEYRGATPTKQATVQYTYIFKAWTPAITSVTQDANYTATFDSVVNTYVVMFLNDDSTLLQLDTLAYGAMPEYRGATPTKQATAQYTYTFNGWNNAIVSVTGDVTYLATYVSTTNKYLIIFQDEDGTPLQQDSVEYGALPAYRGNTPTKQSIAEYTYTFAGWNPSIASVIGNATYTATYNCVVNKYVVMFLNEDSTLLQIDTLAYGAMPEYRGPTPIKPATAQYTYTFKGWDKEILPVAAAETYVAQFDSVVNKYLITFTDEDGTTILQSDSVEYGLLPAYTGATPAKLPTAQYTYSFSGWSPTVAEVTGPAIYTATYSSTINQYSIAFLNYDGTELQRNSINYGVTPAYNGATPIKPATAQYTYTFKGWDKEILPVAAAETYVAQFDSVVNKYLITFTDEDGTTILQSDSVEYGLLPAYTGATPAKLPTAQYTYSFSGWSPTVAEVAGPTTYTATYSSTINQYSIAFLNYDGTELQRSSINYGVTPAYNGATPTKPATVQYTYTFKGWDKEILPVAAAETYVAQFDSVVNKYLITFTDEDGTTILQSDSVEYGLLPAYTGATPAKLPTAQYTYTFSGWSPAVVEVAGPTTYIATFASTTNKYLIIFQDEDGTPLQQDSVEYGSLPAYRGNTPTKQSTAEYTYTFAGWHPSVVSVIGDATYTATYYSVVNKYVITFQNEDGTILQRDTLDYGVIPVYREANPTKESTAEATFTFVGWAPSISAVAEDAVYTATYDSVVNTYVIMFLNEDSTLLQIDTLEYGAMPEYRGEDPVKPNEGDYFYVFTGWEPEVVAVVGDAVYIATYESHGTGFDNVSEKQKPVKVLEDGKMYILMPDGTKYSATGKKVE